jgi:hypothetical protein
MLELLLGAMVVREVVQEHQMDICAVALEIRHQPHHHRAITVEITEIK